MRHLGLAIGLLFLLSACTSTNLDVIRGSSAQSIPQRVELTNVPFFPQQARYCGPAALAMVLAWSGLDVTQEEIGEQTYTPGLEGTLRSAVLGAARRNGRLAAQVDSLDGILREVAAGHPVVVFQNLALSWFPQWHFAVVIGYDLEAGEIILHSGENPRRVTKLETFARTWDRGEQWALVVLPPEQLPASVDLPEILRAGAGLERAEQPKAAASTYANALTRWPASLAAGMGLGNARYAMQDFAGAGNAFEAAADRHPNDPAPWNNLAYALARQGYLDDAVDAAREAVLRGKGDPAYSDTLLEILSLDG